MNQKDFQPHKVLIQTPDIVYVTVWCSAENNKTTNNLPKGEDQENFIVLKVCRKLCFFFCFFFSDCQNSLTKKNKVEEVKHCHLICSNHI